MQNKTYTSCVQINTFPFGKQNVKSNQKDNNMTKLNTTSKQCIYS